MIGYRIGDNILLSPTVLDLGQLKEEYIASVLGPEPQLISGGYNVPNIVNGYELNRAREEWIVRRDAIHCLDFISWLVSMHGCTIPEVIQWSF